MPESTNGPQPSTSSRPRGLIDFIRSNGEITAEPLTEQQFDEWARRYLRIEPRRRWNHSQGRSDHFVPRPDRHGVRVTQYESPETATEATPLPRLDAATTAYLADIQFRRGEPTVSWHTDELIPWDAITRVDHDYWPDDCASVAPKPKTEEGLQLFFDKHPHLRGAR